MDSRKEIDLIRRRNATLSQELEEAKDKYDQLKYLNSESAKKAKALIVELEAIKEDWTETMEDLHAKQAECDQLIAVLREMRLIMQEPMGKEKSRWYTQALNKMKEITSKNKN